MAVFRDKFTNKSFETGSFSQLSASVADNGTLGGKVASFITKEKLPYRLIRGDQSHYFDIDKVEKDLIIRKNDTDDAGGTVYVPYKKKNWQEMAIGVGSFVSKSFSSTAYLQISESFSASYAKIDDDKIIVQAVEEFYPRRGTVKQGKTIVDTFVGPVTASFKIFESGSNDGNPRSQSFSATDERGFSGNGHPFFELDFSESDYATHWQLRFDGSSDLGVDLSSSLWIDKVNHHFPGGNTQGDTGSISMTGSNAIGPGDSGSIVGSGTFTQVNGANNEDGSYILYSFRSRIAGDADSGSLYTFLGRSEIAVYGRGQESKIHSASFSYSPTSRVLATGSSVYKTLYYYSGSGAGVNKTSGYDFYVTMSGKGAPVHHDSLLRHNAVVGYYSPSGSANNTTIYVQTSSNATSGLGPTYAFNYQP